MIMQTSVTADVSRKLRTKAAINFPTSQKQLPVQNRVKKMYIRELFRFLLDITVLFLSENNTVYAF